MPKKYFFLLFLNFHFITYGQENYPVPPKNSNSLFYIQHSNNFNTYVYDVNLKNSQLNTKKPIKEYRILYTKNAEVKPLTPTQKRLAYGMVLLNADDNSFKFRLAASSKLVFNLEKKNNRYKIFVYHNTTKIYLDRMLLNINGTGLSTEIKSVILYGKDYNTNKKIEIKVEDF
ncbi:DUF4833 domain-containing protein [uncultured Tenacibaculum sp.]|uniref:DUF4833 domain-containing protein n=1 Tax=uncultured Tenacibaculum sp. TaxID=174713 RepID=UPI002610CD73|nr:DUF4833 domain-containing protein [uncultured Tenacibaculum sp.]